MGISYDVCGAYGMNRGHIIRCMWCVWHESWDVHTLDLGRMAWILVRCVGSEVY